MTLRIGANPTSQLYMGLSSDLAQRTIVGTGALPLKLSISGSNAHRLFSQITDNLELSAPRLSLVAVNPVVREGQGDLRLGGFSFSMSTTVTPHEHATGALAPTLSLSGAGLLHRHAAGATDLSRLKLFGIADVNAAPFAFADLSAGHLTLNGSAVLHKNVAVSFNISFPISISGAGIIHFHVTAQGAIDLPKLIVHDSGAPSLIKRVQLEGVFADGFLEGLLVDSIDLEGVF